MKATSSIEWLAFLFGIVQVVLALKNKVVNFYAGIISVSFYIYVFYIYGLFAESLLNIYYLIVSITGLFLWQSKNALPISKSNQSDYLKALILGLISLGILYFVLTKFTSSNVPFLDAFVTSSAWVGTWLLIKRKLENWIVLNISNLVAIPLQFYKGLELTSLLTCIYFIIAIQGYFTWQKLMKVELESTQKIKI